MSEQENVQMVQQLYAAFGHGDVAAVLNAQADDVEWDHNGPVAIVPWAGVYRGREQVAQFFTSLDETLEFEQFEPREFIAQGNAVVVLGHERSRVKSTGRTFETDWVHVITLREGKYVRVRLYEDTAAAVAAISGG